MLRGGVTGVEQFHVLVVDQRLPSGVAGQADVFGFLADHDVDDPVAAVVDGDAHHDRGFVPYPSVHLRTSAPGSRVSVVAVAGVRVYRRKPLSGRVFPVRREWDLDDLIASWTLVDADQELLVRLHSWSRLGFALMLKLFEIEGRFPRQPGELPPVAVDFVARQLGVPAEGFEVTGRGVERFRAQIRHVLRFRVFSRGDEDKMISWLAAEVCPSELNEDRQREAVLARCRAEKIEPPGRMSRIIGSANRIADERFCAVTTSRLPAGVAQSLWGLIVGDGEDEDDDEPGLLHRVEG